MDHVVYVDDKAKEMEKLLDGSQTMIIRGATGRKLPYGRVHVGDVLYFIRNNGEGRVSAKATVNLVLNSEKMEKEQSLQWVEEHQSQLQLSPRQFKKWAGKRYIVLIGVENVQPVDPLAIDKSGYGNMDDWLPVGDIQTVTPSA